MPFDTDRRLLTAVPRTSVLVLGLLIFGVGAVLAQGTIEGEVLERSTGEPLPGVNVTIPDLTIGAAAGGDGTYEITNVPTGEHTVRARFVGYQTETRTVEVSEGETITLNFSLRRSTMEMDEVLVTGAGGNAERREIGNSIASIEAASIDDATSNSFGDLIQGKVAGASVMANSGQVGTGRTIRLRGNSSVTQGNTPLVYVDGVRIKNSSVGADPEVNQAASPLDYINPNDIERIEIIKGPAATTLYGTEASSGVIQIFTKQGSDGETRFSFSTQQGVNHSSQLGTQDFHSELGVNDCSDEPGCPEDGDWLRAGHTQSYNLSARGGSGALNYFISGQWGRENGVIAPQSADRYSMRGNFNFTITEDLSVQVNNSYSHRNITWIPDGNNAEGFLLNSLRGEAGYTPDGDDSYALEMDLATETDHFTSGASFNWSPYSNVNQSLKLGLDYVNSEYTEEKPFGYFYDPQGSRENDTETESRITLDYTGSVETDITESISSTTSWGGQFYRDTYVNLTGYGYEFSGVGDKVIDSAARTEAFETRITETSGGFFAQERFGWQDQLFVTLGLRVDGHSTFGEDFGLAPYPKLSASYIVSDNNFWPEWWGTMKLRGAYGESGKAPGAFDAIRTYESVSGDDGEPAVTPGNIGASDLGPERSREIELGFEASAVDGRITADFTWYRQRTYDALLNVQPTPSGGFTNTQLRNVGTFEGRGIELDLNFDVVRSENVSWSVGGNYSTSHTNAISTGDAGDIYVGWRNEVREGYPIPVFVQDKVVNPNEIPDDPEDVEFEEQVIGQTYPPRSVGVNTSLTLWKNLTIDVLGEGKYGHVLSSGTAYQNVRRGEWPQCDAIQAQISDGDYSGLTAREIGRCDPNQTEYGMWTRAADFFKIRSASIQYSVPEQWLPGQLRNASMRLQGRNLMTFTDYPGLDPEAYEDGSSNSLYRQEYYNMPPVRSFTFSLNVNF